eukprot:2664572-Rhodomonas_salina.1
MSGTELGYAAICLRACCAMSGNVIACAAHVLRGMSGTVMRYATGVLRDVRYGARVFFYLYCHSICYAMSGTELGYGATGIRRSAVSHSRLRAYGVGVCYAVSSTALACGARHAMQYRARVCTYAIYGRTAHSHVAQDGENRSRPLSAYALPTPCPVLTWRMVLYAYARATPCPVLMHRIHLRGTEIAYGAAACCLSGPDVTCPTVVNRSNWAMESVNRQVT